MKNIVFIFFSLILLSSCSSPEKKAKKAIKEYLKVTLNDFKSYEPVEYGKIERLNSFAEDTLKANRYFTLAEYFADKKLDSSVYYFAKARSITKFITPNSSWKIPHSFRARIPAGGYVLNHYLFYFDQGFSRVTKAFDLSEVD